LTLLCRDVSGTVVHCGTLAVCHGGPRPELDPKLPRQRLTVLTRIFHRHDHLVVHRGLIPRGRETGIGM
jgi:hypothetical protein